MKTRSMLMLLALLVAVSAAAQVAHILPEGSEIKVRTDTAIPAKPAAGASYTASVSQDVMDRSGALAIPRGSRAQLVAETSPDGKDTNLDLRSVTVNGRRYLITSAASSVSSGREGLGANKRTAKYVGGGAAIGVVLGALLGGGKGAAIGGLVGGAAGAGTQVLTGRKKEIPPETELKFKLAQDLQMQGVASRSRSGLQSRPAR